MPMAIEINDFDYIDFDDLEVDKKNDIIYHKQTGEIIDDRATIRYILDNNNKNKAIDNAKEKEIRRIADMQEKKNYLWLDWKKDSYFIKVFRTELREYMKVTKLSTNARAFLFSVQMYIEYPTNRIAKPDGTNFTNAELTELTGLSKNTLNKTLKELEDKHFIKKVGQGRAREIYFNPYLMAGKDIEKSTKKIIDEAGYKPLTSY